MMIISEQEFEIHDMKHEILKNVVIKAFVNAHNKINKQMNIINRTA